MKTFILSLIGIAAAAFGVFAAAFTMAVIDRHGPQALFMVTGVFTWMVLAALGLLSLYGMWIDNVLKDAAIKAAFTRWYLREARRSKSQHAGGEV